MAVRGLVLLGIALQTWVAVSGVVVVFRDSPKDVAVTAGETTVLRCSVQLQGSDREYLKWVHYESDHVLSKDDKVTATAHEDRYSVVGNHENDGEYWLKIKNVQSSDAGEYRCVYGSVYRSATLTVVSAQGDDQPLCGVHPDPSKQRIGRIAEITCTTSRSSQSIDLIWYRDGEKITEAFQSANAMQRVVTAEDNGVKFTCRSVSNEGTTKPSRSCEIMVLVQPPTGLVTPERSILQPGDDATFTCKGTGTPAISRYNWLVNYMYVTSENIRALNRYELLDNNKTLRISDVRKREDGAVITCEVSIASGLTGRASAKLSITSPSVTSASNGALPGMLFPIEDVPYENEKRNIGPTVLKPQKHGGKAGVVAGAVLATIGVILALAVITVLLVRIKMSRQFSMNSDCDSKYLPEASILPTEGTMKMIDECPIYAKPNKVKKGPAPQPPSNGAAPSAGSGEQTTAAQRKKSRKDHHSYEKVDILGLSSPGQSHTLPVRLQSPPPVVAPNKRRSDAIRTVKAQAPLPPGLPPPRKSRPPPTPPTQTSPLSTPGLDLLYADLDLTSRGETSYQSQPDVGVDYAKIRVPSTKDTSVNEWNTNGMHNTS